MQHLSALFMLVNATALAFLCFFLNKYDLTDGVLWYVAQAITYSGAVFGVSIYIRTKLGEVGDELKDYIDNRMGITPESTDQETSGSKKGGTK